MAGSRPGQPYRDALRPMRSLIVFVALLVFGPAAAQSYGSWNGYWMGFWSTAPAELRVSGGSIACLVRGTPVHCDKARVQANTLSFQIGEVPITLTRTGPSTADGMAQRESGSSTGSLFRWSLLSGAELRRLIVGRIVVLADSSQLGYGANGRYSYQGPRGRPSEDVPYTIGSDGTIVVATRRDRFFRADDGYYLVNQEGGRFKVASFQ